MAYVLMILTILTSVAGTAAVYQCKVAKDKSVEKALRYYYEKLTSGNPMEPLDMNPSSAGVNIQPAPVAVPVGTGTSY
jgi:hypothetical protein